MAAFVEMMTLLKARFSQMAARGQNWTSAL
jgi:hypothetical protein